MIGSSMKDPGYRHSMCAAKMDFQDRAGRENFWLTTNYCGIVGFAALLFPSRAGSLRDMQIQKTFPTNRTRHMNDLSVHSGATETLLPADFRWPGGTAAGGLLPLRVRRLVGRPLGRASGPWATRSSLACPTSTPSVLPSTAIAAGSFACSTRWRARALKGHHDRLRHHGGTAPRDRAKNLRRRPRHRGAFVRNGRDPDLSRRGGGARQHPAAPST